MGDMPDREPGDLLRGRYRLVEPLGEGGMAVVWRGYDEVLGRQVALKLPRAGLVGDARATRRMRREAQVAGLLTHPNIAAVHDFGESVRPPGPPVPFVVMPVLDGRALHAVLAEERMPWRAAVTMAAQVASALAAAHARGVVHRDVSPHNIMLTAAGGAQLLDFGIAALAGDPEPEDEDLLGTAGYVAPERLERADVTTAIDVYSLGAVLYQALSGSLPWPGKTTGELLAAQRRLPPAPLPDITGLPPEVADLCHRCLHKRPDQRPTSEHLAARLAHIAGLPAATLAEPNGDNDFAAASTSFLAWPDPHESAAEQAPPQATTTLNRRRRRLALTAAGIALPAVTLLSVAWAGQDVPSTAPASCQVTYQQVNDAASEFAAEVTVHNAGKAALTGWDLRFGWPGDQSVVAAGDAAWRQDGREVTLRPAQEAATLDSGQSYRFAVSGRYQQINAMPAEFAVSGTPCAGTVLAPSATTPPPAASPLAPAPADQPGDQDKGKPKPKDKGKPKPKEKGGPGRH